MDKSPDAFRTISEVAEHLDTPAHVLRFWESRFSQIRPVKRAGGRRYYRPSDVALLAGIKRLLHDEGLTIRGVQRILRDQGARHVAGLLPGEALAESADGGTGAANGPETVANAAPETRPDPSPEPARLSPTPSVPAARAAVQEGLPLFDAPQPASAAPAQAATATPTGRKPTLPEDRTFASLIRALPVGGPDGKRTELADVARRLTALRAVMADRADGEAG
jgi:DNA-binding transcriptional MerR regulator